MSALFCMVDNHQPDFGWAVDGKQWVEAANQGLA
jgi:hypothetical protein